jgi:hypothetical protein
MHYSGNYSLTHTYTQPTKLSLSPLPNTGKVTQKHVQYLSLSFFPLPNTNKVTNKKPKMAHARFLLHFALCVHKTSQCAAATLETCMIRDEGGSAGILMLREAGRVVLLLCGIGMPIL